MLSGIILICSKQQDTQYNEKKNEWYLTLHDMNFNKHINFSCTYTHIYVRESGHIIIDVS